jgi:hypothetical protein
MLKALDTGEMALAAANGINLKAQTSQHNQVHRKSDPDLYPGRVFNS